MNLKYAVLVALVAVTDVAAQTGSRPQTLLVDLQSIQIHKVPPPPVGEYWDGSIIGNLFLGSLTGFYPDIEICLRRGTASACRRVCVNAQLYEPEEAVDPNIQPTVCKLEVAGKLPIARVTEVQGGAPAREYFDLSVVVNEFDPTLNAEPRRHMGGFSLKPGNQPPLLSEPETCTPSQPCRISIPTKTGTFVASFATTVSGVSGTPSSGGSGTSAPPGDAAPPPAPPAPTTKPAEALSYYEQFKKWLDEFIWDKAKEPAGWRGTVLEGLADQATVAEDKYAACLVDAVKKYELEPRLETSCKGKTGDEAKSCAYDVVGEKSLAQAQVCQSNERTYGFLANMWKSVCAFVGQVCY